MIPLFELIWHHQKLVINLFADIFDYVDALGCLRHLESHELDTISKMLRELEVLVDIPSASSSLLFSPTVVSAGELSSLQFIRNEVPPLLQYGVDIRNSMRERFDLSLKDRNFVGMSSCMQVL